jgi:hypothetical protein
LSIDKCSFLDFKSLLWICIGFQCESGSGSGFLSRCGSGSWSDFAIKKFLHVMM